MRWLGDFFELHIIPQCAHRIRNNYVTDPTGPSADQIAASNLGKHDAIFLCFLHYVIANRVRYNRGAEATFLEIDSLAEQNGERCFHLSSAPQYNYPLLSLALAVGGDDGAGAVAEREAGTEIAVAERHTHCTKQITPKFG